MVDDRDSDTGTMVNSAPPLPIERPRRSRLKVALAVLSGAGLAVAVLTAWRLSPQTELAASSPRAAATLELAATKGATGPTAPSASEPSPLAAKSTAKPAAAPSKHAARKTAKKAQAPSLAKRAVKSNSKRTASTKSKSSQRRH